MSIALNGIWRCTHCGNLEKVEREVMCWECGKGEMRHFSRADLDKIFSSQNIIQFQPQTAA